MNLRGAFALFAKEVARFRRVTLQTLAAPALTTLLYLVIFGHLFGRRVENTTGVSYLAFLVPGLAMMAALQNAFANSSSSLIQSRMTGSLVFVLLSPLGPLEIVGAYVLAAAVRGVLVAAVILLAALPFVSLPLAHPLGALAFAFMGGVLLGALGFIAGIHARKFDELAGFQNFVVVPLSFLSGAFYSIGALPARWHRLSLLNPLFYAIDGFRHSFFGRSEVAVVTSLTATGIGAFIAFMIAVALTARGYRIRN